MHLIATGNTFQVRNKESGPLTLWTSNTEQVRIDSNGKVGVGTSTPATDVHIQSTSSHAELRVETPRTLR